MASNLAVIRHIISGGWSTDLGQNAEAIPDNAGIVSIPFLVDAENIFYELDGGIHKIGGTSKLQAGALESGAQIRGIYDFWRQGTSGSPTQDVMVQVSTKIYKMDNVDGTFEDLGITITDDAVPHWATFDDLLIISNSDNDTPQKWDGTTAGNVGTNTPLFSFGATHKNRFWASGVSSRNTLATRYTPAATMVAA